MATEFSPLAAVVGGLLVGLAAVFLMALHGRILGATGIIGGLLRADDAAGWRLRAALVLGMVLAPAGFVALTGAWPTLTIPVGREALVIGGILVGIGATLGSGCTSGHGVCGLARFSRRSAVATATFMAFAFVTVFVMRHGMGG